MPKKTKVLQSGINPEKLKHIFKKVVYVTGIYASASYLTIKADHYNNVERVKMLEEFSKQLKAAK